MDKGNDFYECDRQRNITLVDFIIIILKYKLLIFAVVIISVILAFIYLNISARSFLSLPPGSMPQTEYYSESLIELHTVTSEHLPTSLNANDVNRSPIIMMSDSAAEKLFSKYHLIMMSDSAIERLFSKYHLLMLRYMKWDGKNKKWMIEKLYSWDEKNQKLMTKDGNSSPYKIVIPTIKIKIENNVCHVIFSCGDPVIPSGVLNDYLIYISERFRFADLAKINSKIDLFNKLRSKNIDRNLKDKLADQLILNIELASVIKNNKFYPFNAITPPTLAKNLGENESWKGPDGPADNEKRTIILIATGAAAFIFALLWAFFLENLQRTKKMHPEKYNLVKKYMRLGVNKKLK